MLYGMLKKLFLACFIKSCSVIGRGAITVGMTLVIKKLIGNKI